MAKRAVILLYFVLNFLIDLTKTNVLNPKNVLFSAEMNSDQELIFDGPENYIKVSVAKETIISGRRSIPVCFAVGCTKTALICEEKTGRMITTFRSVNDTRQAFFKSSLVKEDMVLTVNCRDSHIACCFNRAIKQKPVAARPSIKPITNPSHAVHLPNPLGAISSAPHPPRPQQIQSAHYHSHYQQTQRHFRQYY